MEKRITLLASDESTAPLYRVRLLAHMLALRHEVEVVGFHFDPKKLDPLAPRDFPYIALEGRDLPFFLEDARRMRQLLRGGIVYAMKPRPSSLGLALWHKQKTGVPVAVDVDDDELSMIPPYSKHPLKNLLFSLPKLHQPNCFAYTSLLDPFIRGADQVTVVSEHFRKRYGGDIVPQYVDTERFHPAKYDRNRIRMEDDLGDKPAIAFVGIAQPNKGVGEILDAMDALKGAWRLWIIGPKTPYAYQLAARDRRVILFGTQPPEKAPRFLAAADLVVLPQRRGPHSDGQMPIKLFEAMAMGKPIVATALADIPRILDGCGVVVPPEDPRALQEALVQLEEEPDWAFRLGRRARMRCESRYSWDVGAQHLETLFAPLFGGAR
ncbi:MAG: glycosyltransferase family 4 protein [Bacteroidota bacterium]